MYDELQLLLRRIETIPSGDAELALIIGDLAALKAMALARLLAGNAAPCTQDRLCDAKEASALLGQSVSWLRKNHAHLPFARRNGRSVRFSVLGIESYINGRKQPRMARTNAH